MSNYRSWRKNQVDVALIPEIEIARLAAFIDGEGSIGLLPCGKQRKAEYLQIRVTIAQADVRLMEYLLNTFGGRYEQGPGGTNRPMYYWITGSHYGCSLLKRCLPWLIVKRDQAEVVLQYQETVVSNNRKPVSDPVRQQRQDLKSRLTLLKHPERATA